MASSDFFLNLGFFCSPESGHGSFLRIQLGCPESGKFEDLIVSDNKIYLKFDENDLKLNSDWLKFKPIIIQKSK